jgi:hypothetical protein
MYREKITDLHRHNSSAAAAHGRRRKSRRKEGRKAGRQAGRLVCLLPSSYVSSGSKEQVVQRRKRGKEKSSRETPTTNSNRVAKYATKE